MRAEPGTYALILRNRKKGNIQIGRWSQIEIKPGYYIYVGSAFGPGGVQARVSRHCSKVKSKHWHIDFLREFASPEGAWYCHKTERLEHQWAHALCDITSVSAIQGFGCSDCNCYSHLFYSAKAPDAAQFGNVAGCKVDLWSYRNTG